MQSRMYHQYRLAVFVVELSGREWIWMRGWGRELCMSGGGDHSWVERAEKEWMTRSHTGAGVFVCAVLLKEVFLDLIRTAVNAQPTVFFFFSWLTLCHSALTIFMSQSLSLFLWGHTASVTLPCNRCHCPTCVAASVIEAKRNDERGMLSKSD